MGSDGDVVKFVEHSARDSFMLFAGDFSSVALLAISSILVARLLGPEGYGVYSISFVVPALMVSLVSLGLDSAAIRFPAKYIAEGRSWITLKFIRMILAFRLITGLAASLACLLLSDVLSGVLLDRPGVAPYVRLLSMLVLFETLFSLLYGLFIGLNSSRDASAIKVLMAAFKGSLAPLLVLLGLGVYGALLGHIVGYIVPSIIGLLALYFYHYKRLNPSFRIEECGGQGCFWETLKYSMPLYGSSLLALLLGNYQAILLAKLFSDAEVGCFRAALNISAMLTVVTSPIFTALFPAFSRLDSRGLRERIEEFLNLSVKYSSLIVIPLAALIASTSSQFVDVIYGAGYAPAGGYLAFYSIIHMLIGLGSGVFGSLFNGVGETSLTLRLNVINLAVFMSIAPPLAYSLGIFGIIGSLFVSNLISTLYAYDLAKRKLGVRLNLSASARIYVSSALSAAPTVFLALYMKFPSIISLVVCSFVYAVSYLTLAPLLRAVSRDDLSNLERIFGGIRLLNPIVRLVTRYECRVLGWCKVC